MSMQTYLDGLRAKPEHVRRRYAFWGALSITAIIFAFWVSSFSISSSTAVTANVDKVKTPSHSLVAGVGSFANDIKELIFGSKKIKYSEVEVTSGN